MFHDKGLLNAAIKEYLDNLPNDQRKILKEELTYNLAFKEDFSSRLGELSVMISASAVNNEELFNRSVTSFIKREHTDNIHIINMYKYYMNKEKLLDGLTEMYGENSAKDAYSSVLSIMDKYKLNYELEADLNNNSKSNKALKI